MYHSIFNKIKLNLLNLEVAERLLEWR